jgi:hypothetical protein
LAEEYPWLLAVKVDTLEFYSAAASPRKKVPCDSWTSPAYYLDLKNK